MGLCTAAEAAAEAGAAAAVRAGNKPLPAPALLPADGRTSKALSTRRSDSPSGWDAARCTGLPSGSAGGPRNGSAPPKEPMLLLRAKRVPLLPAASAPASGVLATNAPPAPGYLRGVIVMPPSVMCRDTGSLSSSPPSAPPPPPASLLKLLLPPVVPLLVLRGMNSCVAAAVPNAVVLGRPPGCRAGGPRKPDDWRVREPTPPKPEVCTAGGGCKKEDMCAPEARVGGGSMAAAAATEGTPPLAAAAPPSACAASCLLALPLSSPLDAISVS